MFKIFQKIFQSFNNEPGGYSARKLTAFTGTGCIVLCHLVWLHYAFKNKDFQLLPSVLPSDIALITACLGLTTYERVKSNPDSNTNTTNVNIKEEVK